MSWYAYVHVHHNHTCPYNFLILIILLNKAAHADIIHGEWTPIMQQISNYLSNYLLILQ